MQAFNAAVLANVPLFQTEAILSVPEIILQPNASEIDKMTVQCIRDCVEVTKVIFFIKIYVLPESACDYNELILLYTWANINVKGKIHIALS